MQNLLSIMMLDQVDAYDYWLDLNLIVIVSLCQHKCEVSETVDYNTD